MKTLQLGIAFALISAGGHARAATYLVNSTANTFDGSCDAINCTIRDAVAAAEATAAVDDIHLQTNATYVFVNPHTTFYGLPTISTQMTIWGHGSTLYRAPYAGTFQFANVLAGGNLTLRDMKVQSFKSNYEGGAIINAGTLYVYNVFFRYNVAGIRGGAIWNSPGGWLQVERSTFALNQARYGGGLMSTGTPSTMSGISTLIITKSSIVSNVATEANPMFGTGVGGGLRIDDHHSVLIVDTSIDDNYAQGNGGGVGFVTIPNADSVVFRNVTIAHNTAGGIGGGLHYSSCPSNYCPLANEPRFENSIIANNSAPSNATCYGAFWTDGKNVRSTNGSCVWNGTGTDFLTATPIGFTTPVANGLAGGEGRRLLSTNPAISYAPAGCNVSDQLYLSRVNICDSGAIEYRDCKQIPVERTMPGGSWSFDAPEGPSEDAIGAVANPAVWIGEPLSDDGMVGRAVCLSRGSYLSVRDDDHELDFLSTDGGADGTSARYESFTLDAWVRTWESGVQVIADKSDVGQHFVRGYSFYLTNGRLALRLGTGEGVTSCNGPNRACDEYVTPPEGPDLRDGLWHHVAAIVDRNERRGGLMIDGRVELTFEPRLGDITSVADLWIGQRRFGKHTKASDLCVDELNINKVALAPGIVTGIWDAAWAGRCWPYLPGPVGALSSAAPTEVPSSSAELIERSSDDPPVVSSDAPAP